MIVFYIILTILIIISLFFLLLCISSLEIEINKLWFDSNNKKHKKLENYLFYIRIKVLGKITWIKIKIDNNKIQTILNSKVFKSKIFNQLNKYDNIRNIILKNKQKILKKDNIKYIKKLDIKFKKINLYIELSASSTSLTTFAVSAIAAVISIILARKIRKYDTSKYNYKIIPKYEDIASLKIQLNCIINIKIVHIMNVIYMVIKRRRVEYDQRTSDRRTYVCSDE